ALRFFFLAFDHYKIAFFDHQISTFDFQRFHTLTFPTTTASSIRCRSELDPSNAVSTNTINTVSPGSRLTPSITSTPWIIGRPQGVTSARLRVSSYRFTRAIAATRMFSETLRSNDRKKSTALIWLQPPFAWSSSDRRQSGGPSQRGNFLWRCGFRCGSDCRP